MNNSTLNSMAIRRSEASASGGVRVWRRCFWRRWRGDVSPGPPGRCLLVRHRLGPSALVENVLKVVHIGEQIDAVVQQVENEVKELEHLNLNVVPNIAGIVSGVEGQLDSSLYSTPSPASQLDTRYPADMSNATWAQYQSDQSTWTDNQRQALVENRQIAESGLPGHGYDDASRCRASLMRPTPPPAKRRRSKPTTICWRWHRGNWPSCKRCESPDPGSRPKSWPSSNRKRRMRRRNGSGSAAVGTTPRRRPKRSPIHSRIEPPASD